MHPHKVISKRFEEEIPDMTNDEKNALIEYRKGSFEAINLGLVGRWEVSEQTKLYIQLIDGVFERAHCILDEVVLYRGVRKLRVGLNKAYMSCSRDKTVALQFMTEEAPERFTELQEDMGCYVLIVDPGVKYINYAGDISIGEDEILLQRNLHLTLIHEYVLHYIKHWVIHVSA